MIKSITVTNYLGDSITIELARPELSGFVVQAITGLGPGKATINTSEESTRDGGLYNSARLSKRNIVIGLKYFHWSDKTIEELRHLSYKYFPIKRNVKLLIETDDRKAEIEGYVENNDPDIFSKGEGADISIICPDPYFYSSGEDGVKTTIFSGVEPMFEFPFENDLTMNWVDPPTDPIQDLVAIIRYSPNADGSGMTDKQQTNSKYVGIGYIPRGMIEHENLLLNSKDFTGWTSNYGGIVNNGDYSIKQANVPVSQQISSSNYADLLRQQNLSFKPDTIYTLSFYEEESSGEYSTYIFSDVATEEQKIMTSEGVKTTYGDTKINWIERGIGLRKWATFKTGINIDTGPFKNLLFRYFYKNPKVDYSFKVSRVSLVKGSDVVPWTPAPADWLAIPGNMTWIPIDNSKTLIMGAIQNKTETIITYDGDSETGIIIKIHAVGTATNITIYNVGTRESMRLDTDKIEVITGSGIIAGDDIIICTIKGQKSVTLLRQGEEINILNCLDRDSDWPQLSKGDNIFAYTAETGASNLQFSVENRIIYEGV